MQITIGRIVAYKISAEEAFIINDRRRTVVDADNEPIYRGNQAGGSEEFPLLVTKVWSDGSINGQLFLDGNDSLWIASSTEGIGPHTWRWPNRD